MNEKTLSQTFHQILEQHRGILHKVAKAYCQNDDDRQDLLQEMMLQIWKSLHRYNSKFAISTWLYRICLNVAISFYRKNTQRQHLYVPFMEANTSIQEEISTEVLEKLNWLNGVIAELNDLDKALMLLYLEDKNHAEMAEIMGLSITNVGTKLGRIRERLKKRISQLNS